MYSFGKQTFIALTLIALLGAGCTPTSKSGTTTTPAAPTNDAATAQPDVQAKQEDTTMSGFPGVLPTEEMTGKVIHISTPKGDIVFELYGDTAPKAVSNFIALTKKGFYNGLTFHRREEGFVIQGGDPAGNGTGGPGYTFEDELTDSHNYDRGIVAMANRGPDTNGSQFFILLADYPLPKQYTIFGKVLSGLDVVDKIAVGDVMTTVSVEDAPVVTQ